MKTEEDPRKILVIRLDAIGDSVLMAPFLRELRSNYPQAEITLVVDSRTHNLLELCPYVNSVRSIDFKGSLGIKRNMLRCFKFFMQHLRKEKFDLAVNPRWATDYYGGALLAFLSRAKKRVAYSEHCLPLKQRKNKRFDRFYTHLITDSECKHEVVRNLGVIELLGKEVQDDSLELWIDEKDDAFADGVLRREYSLHQDEMLVCLGVGSKLLRKMWPIERYYEVAVWLKKKYNARILLLGNKQERVLAEKIAKDPKELSFIDLIGRTTLRQSTALIKHCKAFIGNDTGLMHIAAAMHKPIICVTCWSKRHSLESQYGPFCFVPWKINYIRVEPEESVAPCKDECFASEPHCIRQVKTEDVMQAASKLFSEI